MNLKKFKEKYLELNIFQLIIYLKFHLSYFQLLELAKSNMNVCKIHFMILLLNHQCIITIIRPALSYIEVNDLGLTNLVLVTTDKTVTN